MRLVGTEILVARGEFARSPEWAQIQAEIAEAVRRVVWPPGNDGFVIYPESGKKRGEGNGVVPIKIAFLEALQESGWQLERQLAIGNMRYAGKIDAIKPLPDGRFFAVEWETGNISSSHRSMNKMALGVLQGTLAGGGVVLPTRRLSQYLTDRIGNFEEVAPYFPLWRHLVTGDGVLIVVAVEQDANSWDVPRIEKGTDGRALV